MSEQCSAQLDFIPSLGELSPSTPLFPPPFSSVVFPLTSHFLSPYLTPSPLFYFILFYVQSKFCLSQFFVELLHTSAPNTWAPYVDSQLWLESYCCLTVYALKYAPYVYFYAVL